MSTYKTNHETLWAGEFGDQYTERNANAPIASNLALFSKALARCAQPASCIEFGANIGLNLQALRLLFPDQEQHAIEINKTAVNEMRKLIPGVTIYETSILEYMVTRTFDLVLTKGVLVLVDPASLPKTYDLLHAVTGHYLLVAEYYNPFPVDIPYRGHATLLSKRDFAGEIMDRHRDLRLADYGFVYRRDPSFPLDDVTWFLLEKSGG
jgi:spore coat polysaccharide biosynthesis protein SpsF